MDFNELFKNHPERFNDTQIKKLIDEGKLNAEMLIREGFLAQEKYNELFPPPSADDHKRNIREYSNSKIKSLIDDNVLSEFELVSEGYFTQEEMNDILQKPRDLVKIDWGDWKDVPPLMPDRTDVFVLGIAASGKSSFMAGLIHYTKKIGKLRQEIDNTAGFKYVAKLTNAVRNGVLPPATPVEYIQYMSCTFVEQNSVKHPLTFIEMSGENFENSFAKSKDQLPKKFSEYLFSDNFKIIFLTIDYGAHKNLDIAQSSQFEYIVKFFAKYGTFKNTDALCILVTKWDRSPDQSLDAAKQYLREEYLSLVEQCEEFAEEFNFQFNIFTFSLGEVDERRNSYTFQEDDSAKIYNWLCGVSRPEIPKKKKGFLGRIFGS